MCEVSVLVTVHGSVRAPRERNVAAKEPAITNSLKSATLWGGVGGWLFYTSRTRPHPHEVDGVLESDHGVMRGQLTT